MTHTQAAVAILKASGERMTLPELCDRINATYKTGTTMATLTKLTKRLAKSGSLGMHRGPRGRRPPQSLVWYIKDPVLYVYEQSLTEKIMGWVAVESATYSDLSRALNATHKQVATAAQYLARRKRVVIRRHAQGNIVDMPERFLASVEGTNPSTNNQATTPYRTVWRPYPSTLL